MSVNPSQFVEYFRSASPYIHVHRGKTFVVQFDDDIIETGAFTNLVHDLALLNSFGIQVILVFGTRRTIENLLNKNNLSLNYHNGMRITDEAAMEYVKEAVGKIRIEIESRLSIGLGNTPMSNAHLRVSSGNYVTAKPVGIIDGIDFQYTGDIRNIDAESIKSKLQTNEIVLISPIGYSPTGEAFNISVDALAARIASDLNADKLIHLMKAEGLKDENDKLIRQLNQKEAEDFLEKTEKNRQHYRYIKSAVNACRKGVHRVHLIDCQSDGTIILELFSRDGVGTMISAVPYDVDREACIDDITSLLELIEPLERQGVLVTRSREKLELEIDHFTILERDGVIIGCGALYPLNGSKAAELACLVVHHDYQKDGRGEQLLSTIESMAKLNGIKKLYVLTTHAEHWFLEHGFIAVNLDDLPVEKKSLYNFQRNSKVLAKELQ